MTCRTKFDSDEIKKKFHSFKETINIINVLMSLHVTITTKRMQMETTKNT